LGRERERKKEKGQKYVSTAELYSLRQSNADMQVSVPHNWFSLPRKFHKIKRCSVRTWPKITINKPSAKASG